MNSEMTFVFFKIPNVFFLLLVTNYWYGVPKKNSLILILLEESCS